MKPLIKSKDSKLSAASRAAVNKVLDRINARGNKKGDATPQNSDSAKVSWFVFYTLFFFVINFMGRTKNI